MWIWRLFWCFCTWHRFCAFFKEMQNRQRWLQTCQPSFKLAKIQFLLKSASLNKFSYVCIFKLIFPNGSPQTDLLERIFPNKSLWTDLPKRISPKESPRTDLPKPISPNGSPQADLPERISPNRCPQTNLPKGTSQTDLPDPTSPNGPPQKDLLTRFSLTRSPQMDLPKWIYQNVSPPNNFLFLQMFLKKASGYSIMILKLVLKNRA